jgi:transposase-like protein
MTAKNPLTGTAAKAYPTNLSALFTDEGRARCFLETQRWPNGVPVCPYCGGKGYPLVAKPGSKSPGRLGLKKCKDCRRQFTVRVGTIFEESKLPLSKWLRALDLMTSSSKGVSSRQIARELGVTPKSAWSLALRIREAMRGSEGCLPEPVHEAVRQRFSNLVAVWKSDRGHSSKLTDLVIHPAYQQIIGMGDRAIPLLLEEMRERPDHWDWALRAITGSDPVPRESWGKLREIANAWLAWGKGNGYAK